MAQLGNMTRDYFGVTLYVTVRGGKAYACRADNWKPDGDGFRVYVRAWPGYGHYSGTVHLTKAEMEEYFRLQKLAV